MKKIFSIIIFACLVFAASAQMPGVDIRPASTGGSGSTFRYTSDNFTTVVPSSPAVATGDFGWDRRRGSLFYYNGITWQSIAQNDGTAADLAYTQTNVDTLTGWDASLYNRALLQKTTASSDTVHIDLPTNYLSQTPHEKFTVEVNNNRVGDADTMIITLDSLFRTYDGNLFSWRVPPLARIVMTFKVAVSVEGASWLNVDDILGSYGHTIGGSSSDTIFTQAGVPLTNGDTITYAQQLGTIYNQNTWANLSDFTDVSSGATASGGKISFTGGSQSRAVVGSNNTDYTKYLRVAAADTTCLDQWKTVAKFKVNQVPSSTSYGFGLGLLSTHSSGSASQSNAIAYFNMTNGTGSGRVFLILGTNDYTAVQSPTALTFSQNDYIILTCERDGAYIIATAENVTSGGIVSASWLYSTTLATGVTTYSFLPNTGEFAITNQGGDFILDSLNISSRAMKDANLVFVGDSKTACYNATKSTSFPSLVRQRFAGVNISAGPIDGTTEVRKRLTELINLRPKKVVLCIGRNDLALSVPFSTTKANIRYIDSILILNNIKPIWLDGIYETSVSQTTLVNFIDTLTRLQGRVIFAYNATNVANAVASDNTHPSFLGHRIVADLVFGSHIVVDEGNYLNDILQPEQRNPSFESIQNEGSYISTKYGTLMPANSATGDVILSSGSAIRSATSGVTFESAIVPNSSGVMQFRNYFETTTNYNFEWYGANGTTGTQTRIAGMASNGIFHLGSTNRASLNSGIAAGEIALTAGKGFTGFYTAPIISSNGQYARIIPMTITYRSELRNYSQRGGWDFYGANAVDNNQTLGLSILGDGTVDLPSTTSALGLPRLTTTQRNALGKIIGTLPSNVGSGYTTATVNVSGGGGSGMAITANIVSGQITSYTITNPGSGYTSSPTLSVSGDGTSASLTGVFSLLNPGLLIQNTTTGYLNYWDGTAWRELVSQTFGDATYFKQNGNSFGAAAVLGTNDNNTLALETNGIQRILVNTDGTTVQEARTAGTSTTINTYYYGVASPADDDEMLVKYDLENSTGAQETYAQVKTIATNVANGSEEGSYIIGATNAGTVTDMLEVYGQGVRNYGAAISKLRTNTASGTSAIAANDYYVRIDATTGAQTLTLPTAFSGRTLVFKRIDNNAATVITFTGTVDGSVNPTSTGGGSPIAALATQYASITLIANGSTWDVVD